MKKLIISLIALLATLPALADDYYIITDTFGNQKDAQIKAAEDGGWVLNANFYSNMSKDLYAIVRGPYATKEAAQNRRKWLTSDGHYQGSYVKNVGKITLSVRFGDKEIDPRIVAMLLGEIRIEASEHKGGENPCEPEKPYTDYILKYITSKAVYDKKKGHIKHVSEEKTVDIGHSWQDKATQKIERMHVCIE